MGLFAVRFFRTKVRVFYLLPWAQVIFGLIFAVAFALLYVFLQVSIVAAIVALVAAGLAMFAVGKKWAWGAFRAPSIWVIGVWVVGFNLAPALLKLAFPDPNGGGGVAYWAHIGGFALGALYAALVGGVDEGKTEYQVEDAHHALQNSSSDEALARAEAILRKDAHNAQAHEVAARGYDRRRDFPNAARHYERALENYWKSGARESALRLYGLALENHPNLELRSALLLNFGGAYAQNAMWNEALAVWVRLIEEFPGTPEAEIAFLRSAQAWTRHFNNRAEAVRQLELFVSLYPQSQWRGQAELALAAGRTAMERE